MNIYASLPNFFTHSKRVLNERVISSHERVFGLTFSLGWIFFLLFFLGLFVVLFLPVKMAARNIKTIRDMIPVLTSFGFLLFVFFLVRCNPGFIFPYSDFFFVGLGRSEE